MDSRGLDAIHADDVLIDQLAEGGEGEDELGRLLAGLRDEARADMPEAPLFVVPQQRSRPWAAGLIGAAAATMVIAVGGIVVHQAGFLGGGDREVLVALAGTLEKAQTASDSGDSAAARRLLDHAQSILAALNDEESSTATTTKVQVQPRAARVTETVTVRPGAPVESQDDTPQAPQQVKGGAGSQDGPQTVTVESTKVVTETVPAAPGQQGEQYVPGAGASGEPSPVGPWGAGLAGPDAGGAGPQSVPGAEGAETGAEGAGSESAGADGDGAQGAQWVPGNLGAAPR